MKSFAAQIDQIKADTLVKMTAVMQESIQDVLEDAQTPVGAGGRMPVDTGNLRNSLASELNGGGFGPEGAGAYALTIAGMEIGDTARFAWTAAYAMRLELGFSGADSLGRNYEQPGRHFVGTAAAKFSAHVEANTARLKK